MSSRFYRAYEFLIRSEITIPGAIVLAGEDQLHEQAADIEIGFGAAVLSEAVRCEGPFRYADGRLLFEMPAVAKYLCENGRRITIEPLPGVSETDIADILVATALPALLWMRGEIVLHAAGFVPEGGDKAIAVCGPSRSGKSTILRDMVARHCRVVGDDTVRLRLVDKEVMASGLPARFCWNSEGTKARVSHDVPPENALVSERLAAVLILVQPRGEFHFEKVTKASALQQLLLQRHRQRVPRLLGVEGNFLAEFARLTTLGVYLWRRPEGTIALSEEEIVFLTNRSCMIEAEK
jgi:hypothetical protein